MLRELSNHLRDAFLRSWRFWIESPEKVAKAALRTIGFVGAYYLLPAETQINKLFQLGLAFALSWAIVWLIFALWPFLWKRALKEKMENVTLLVIAVSGLICLAATLWYFVDRARGPILWSWNLNAPVMIDFGRSNVIVTGFQVHGFNRSDKWILPQKAWIRTEAGDVLPLTLSLLPGQYTAAVPPRRRVEASLPLLNDTNTQQVTPAQFLEKYPSFRFFYYYKTNGGEENKLSEDLHYEKFFSRADVIRLFRNADDAQKRFLRMQAEQLRELQK